MDINLLKPANKYIGKLARGISPITNEIIPKDDTVNNINISRCLFYVNDVLDKVIKNDGIN